MVYRFSGSFSEKEGNPDVRFYYDWDLTFVEGPKD